MAKDVAAVKARHEARVSFQTACSIDDASNLWFLAEAVDPSQDEMARIHTRVLYVLQNVSFCGTKSVIRIQATSQTTVDD